MVWLLRFWRAEGMAAAEAGAGEGEELLVRSVEEGGELCVGERSWRLNFDGLRRQESEQQKPPRSLHDCLGMLAQRPGDVLAEYYNQQLEMLEGFSEMDTLTDRGCLPGLSKVCNTIKKSAYE